MSLSFALTPEQEEFRKVVKEFADTVIEPVAGELAESGEFPTEIVKHDGGR